FSSRRRHTRWPRDWSSDVCSSDLDGEPSKSPTPLMPLTVQVRMASNASRAQFVAELAQLHRLQLKSIADATFVGWTHEQEVAHRSEERRVGKGGRARGGRER